MPILFLDFDGVLRRNGSPLYKLESELVNNLEEVLRAAPTVKIMITSSWREAFGQNEMRSLFSADIAARIEGCTPSRTHHKDLDATQNSSVEYRRGCLVSRRLVEDRTIVRGARGTSRAT